MQLFCAHAALALALLLALLTPGPGGARQAPAQLRVEPAGCPSDYVLMAGGQCVQLQLARQYREDDQLDPRSTGFRPVRRRGRPWTGEWSGPGLAASNPELRHVPASGVELEQRARQVEVVQSPAEEGERRRGHRRRGQHGRRGGRRRGGRGGKRRQEGSEGHQVAEEATSAPALLTADGGDPVTPADSSCPPGRMGRKGRCRVGRRRGKGGRSRDRAGRRNRNRVSSGVKSRRRPCRKGFVRLSKGQCIPAREPLQEGAPTSDSTESTQQTPALPTGLSDSGVQPSEAPDQDETTAPDQDERGAPRRRQGQRRRGSRRRHGGRRRRLGGRRGGRPGARPGDGGPARKQPNSGAQDSGPQPDGQPEVGRPDSRAPGGRTAGRGGRPVGRRPCPPGQVRWRRGRCISPDRLQTCPDGSKRQPGVRCVRCGLHPLPDSGRCPVGCSQTGDKCACCQPSRRHQPQD